MELSDEHIPEFQMLCRKRFGKDISKDETFEKGAIGGSLKPKSLQELQRIIQRDYGVVLSDEETEKLGLSLLKITRLAMTAFNRAEDKHAITTNT